MKKATTTTTAPNQKKNSINLNTKQQEKISTPKPSRQMSSKSQISSKRSRTNLFDDNGGYPEWEKLSTGLQVYLNEEIIKKWWESNKIKQTVIDYLTKFFERLKIINNFESMDIAILAEFHVFNLIFAKQDLHLSDYKASILINLLWTLLISNNDDYGQLALTQNEFQMKDQNVKQKSEQAENDYLTSQLQSEGNNQEQGNQTNKTADTQSSKAFKSQNLKRKKNAESDLASLQFWLKKHAFDANNGVCKKIFELSEVQKISEFTQKSYFDNYNLYKYSMIKKRTNEEIRYMLTIDFPMYVPPLSEALFMGQRKFLIEDEDKEREEQKDSILSLNKIPAMESPTNSQRMKSQENYDSLLKSQQLKQEDYLSKSHLQQSQQQEQEDPAVTQVKSIADDNFKTLRDGMELTINQRNQFLEEKTEEILNPKKKK